MARSTRTKAPAPAPRIGVQSASFNYMVDYETSQSRDCEAGGCSGMCRCSKIDRVWVTSTSSVGPHCLKLVVAATGDAGPQPYEPTKFETYCIQRLMVHHGCYQGENYDIGITGGFYGQEIGQIRFSHMNDLGHDIWKMMALPTDRDKLMYVFELEYGFIADIVKETDSVELVEIELGQIQPSAGAVMLKRQKAYLYEMTDEMVVGVVMNNLLIDGNHRFSYLIGVHGKSHKAIYINLFSAVEGQVIEHQLTLGHQ